MESEEKKKRLVLRCIDFRTDNDTRDWLEKNGVEEGSYYLYASAGASGNPNGFLETLAADHPETTVAVDHQDCGFYKKNGDDSPEHHHHNLELLGTTVHEQNPDINYQYHLLPVDDQRHTCEAAAIILGQPDMVKLSREKIKELGLSNNCDIIARPYELSTNDETIWNDLEISMALHSPSKILLFEKDGENATKLMEKIKEVATHAQIEPFITPKKN